TNRAFPALTSRSAGLVASACRAVDGVPLAVALIAGHAASLSSVGPPPRTEPATAAAAAAGWSYAQLSSPEQALLRRLSLCAGGCARGHAEAVCSGSGLPPEEVFECLARLVGCGLVSADTGDPEARYHLARAVRQLAADRLEDAGERNETMDRLTGWVSALA